MTSVEVAHEGKNVHFELPEKEEKHKISSKPTSRKQSVCSKRSHNSKQSKMSKKEETALAMWLNLFLR